MELPTNSNPQKVIFAAAVSGMANQVTFEGYLARAWTYNNHRFLRLANQRLPQEGRQSDGRLTVESDYVTVRLDPGVYFDMDRAVPGLHLVVRGRIEGHDIPETIGDILRHCNLNVRVPQDIQHITVTRPAVQIYGTSLEFRRDRSQRPSASRERAHASSPEKGTTTEGAPSPDGIQPGQDVSEVAERIEAHKAQKEETEASPKKSTSGKTSKKSATTKKETGKKAK